MVDSKTDKQFESLRKRLYEQYQWGIRPAAISLSIFGVLVLVAWYLTNDGSTMSTMLMLAGISVIILSFLLYFLTPDTYLRGEVADAMSISSTLNTGKMLSSLLIEAKGVYVPPGDHGLLRVFIPISADIEVSSIQLGSQTFNASTTGTRGISLIPPGYGLFKYSQSIGAVFTADGLENEIKDVMENGLELASSVNVKTDGDHITVSMKKLANEGMCIAVRRENPGICVQTGCPICSFVGCMVVSGTGRKARIEKIHVTDHIVNITFKLI
jgi:hypothetical protein